LPWDVLDQEGNVEPTEFVVSGEVKDVDLTVLCVGGDQVKETMKKALKWARDREADQLIWVKKSVEEFFRELKGANVLIGFEVKFLIAGQDEGGKNTTATVTAGKFYLTMYVQDVPAIRELNLDLIYVDDYSEIFLEYLNQ